MHHIREANNTDLPYLKQGDREDLVTIGASEQDGFLSEAETALRLSHSSSRQPYLLWLKYPLLVTVWVISLAVTSYISRQSSYAYNGLGRVLDTELTSVQPAIETQRVRFEGTLDFDENSTLIQTFWDLDSPRYTGEPSDELDARWKSLYKVDGVDLHGVEADAIRGKTFEKPGGWSIVSLDVFHQNMVRQALRPDYYTRHDPEPAYTVHISKLIRTKTPGEIPDAANYYFASVPDHCLDHLRQAVMCHSDVTPLPVLWAEKEDHLFEEEAFLENLTSNDPSPGNLHPALDYLDTHFRLAQRHPTYYNPTVELRPTTGLQTIIEPARKYIQEHERRFDGALSYNASGNLVIESTPGGEQWIGQPTPEMDSLWDRVESGSIIMLEGSEANMVRDKTALFDGYWLTGLDVIHQMHCLNKIRKALYPEYYQPEQSVPTEQLHVEHCFDYIRQAVMCNADLTPVMLTWYSSAQTFGPDFHTTHMCRDFEALLEWSIARTSKAIKGKGSGIEAAKDPQLVIPGSLQDLNGVGHGGH
ncbi:hypothetical protein ABOM_009995 [Aspergillus bombycis]|uniref:Tat pathway signal sequence n=1 Tax=Aspergillus bombycis TaxID=109264 RepID=A0A1F7ZQE4_9EURO|nr:hypothetical protein ABOM_009995 [Aspergillus bombycis]OGM41674.1 hypothetical protein ABOM_009995 [Aspergillus bombycis]